MLLVAFVLWWPWWLYITEKKKFDGLETCWNPWDWNLLKSTKLFKSTTLCFFSQTIDNIFFYVRNFISYQLDIFYAFHFWSNSLNEKQHFGRLFLFETFHLFTFLSTYFSTFFKKKLFRFFHNLLCFVLFILFN